MGEAASSKPAAAQEENNKKKKKKESSPQEDDGDDASKLGFEVIDDEDVEAEGGTVKTAAQKKKEKKAKQLQKLKEEKEKERKGGKPQAQEEKKSEAVKEATPENEGEGEGEEEKDDKKGKKKKGKKEKEEEEAKKKKKPNKAILAAMAETLAKQKEEEERLRAEEEEKERLEEERVAAAIAAKQREEEKRAAKKEREKQKKDQLKAEGKWLTPAQKAAKARADAALEAMRAQGAEVPVAGEKKLTMKERAKLKKQNKSRHAEQAAASKETTPEKVVEEMVEVVKVEESKEPEKAAEEEEDVLDNWMDADDSDKEEEAKKNQSEKKEKASPEGEQVGGDEDSEEEESEDEEEEEESESESEESSSEEEEEDLEETDGKTLAEIKRERAIARIKDRMKKNAEAKSKDNLRSPVVCVLGHVDTGKTKILDKLRRTSVQDGEAGGITQQIGATNVPIPVIKEQCKMVQGFADSPLRLPGLLIIDTPGHESFSNLRDRGSSLCDIAILVIDIMHSLEPQTIESLNLLKKKKTLFVEALNRIDRLYEWKPNKHKDVREVLESQGHNTKMEFEKKKDEVILGLAEQGLNAALFWNNPDPNDYISLVPTSAHSGDGMGNLMAMLVEMSQNMLAERLSFTEELQATVLEVKAIGGFGTTIDVVLVNGHLKFGQTLVLTGTEGPIVTTVKALLTPSKMQDLRVKCGYTEHKELKAAQGVKIAAKELEKAIAGLSVRVAHHQDEVEILKEAAERDLASALNAIKLKPLGVFVQASTLGSLEALLEFLKTSKIPYAGISIGPVHKRDIMKASSMLERDSQWAVILAFDVKVEKEAQEMADSVGVRIFTADIIYHLFDKFMNYREELKNRRKEEFKNVAVFPCKLRILPQYIFNSRDPIVMGVNVEAGAVRMGTPICVPAKEFVFIGIISSIEINNKPLDTAQKGQEVCIKIEAIPGEPPKMVGRHFEPEDQLVSRISRESIDAVKNYFRDEMTKADWQLMIELKKIFDIL